MVQLEKTPGITEAFLSSSAASARGSSYEFGFTSLVTS